MFRRILSFLLVVAMALGTAVPAGAESGITAGEALFGNGTGAALNGSTAAATATAEPSATETATEEPSTDDPLVEDEMYGENDDASITDYPTLQLGDRDSADGVAYIVTLQNRLIALGFLLSSADGVYGEDTQTAIEQFQKMNGLEVTGIADAATQTKLFSDLSTLTTPSPENPAVYGSETIRVQTKLAEWGFLTGSVDGVIGSASEEAISDFKEYVHEYLPPLATPTPAPTPEPTPAPTAVAGALPLVNDILLPTAEPEPTAYVADSEIDSELLAYIDGDVEFNVYRQTVQVGDEGDEVRRVQTRLHQLGYLYDDPDGAFGVNTARALMYFQYKHGLSQSGTADEATQRALFSSSAQESEEYVFPYKIYVDISDQRVYVLGWDGTGYNEQTRAMVCSTGRDSTPTPTGTYQAYGRRSDEWFYFTEFNCYAKWAYGIVGGILFHSVTYSRDKKLNQSSVNNLGRKASHGCIRLSVDDAKWIWDNCPTGTTVVIQE